MKTETRTIHIGERLGPIDWSYDFASHDWHHGGAINPDRIAQSVELLRQLDDGIRGGERWDATTDGGIPRMGWGEVCDLGMYDGWPFWRPIPSVWIASHAGGSWESFAAVVEIRRIPLDANLLQRR